MIGDDDPAPCADGVDLAAAARRLTSLAQGAPRLALGVSGGGDSMALLRIAAAAAAHGGPAIDALTIDHGLRPESAEEAEFVARAAAALGVRHETLLWRTPTRGANLQAAARAARLRLFAAWMRAHGVTTLALGHTADDLAETFLLRLARGSGVDGLAAMPERSVGGALGRDLIIMRPLLAHRRDALRAMLRGLGDAWVEDPSNDDQRFARVRARAALGALAPLGLDVERLAKTAVGLARARAALEAAADAALSVHGDVDPALGLARLDAEALLEPPREIGLRVLARALEWAAGAVYPPRLTHLEAAFDALCAHLATGAPHGRTLHGAGVASEAGAVFLWREAAAAARRPLTLEPGASGIWDRRVAARNDAERAVTIAARGPGAGAPSPLSAPERVRRAAAAATPVRLWADDALRAATGDPKLETNVTLTPVRYGLLDRPVVD